MEHRNLEELRAVAVIRTAPIPTMSREAKLRRWADLLEARGGTVASLFQTEYVAGAVRLAAIRADHSAISVAFADRTLREEGLTGDTYGEAISFFGLSHSEMHGILCYCTGGHALAAAEVARRIRSEVGAPPATCVASLWVVSAVIIGGVALAAAF